jgi:mRNA interferase HigB
MKIIKASRIREYAEKHPGAAASLQNWLKIARVADWHSFNDVTQTFRSADQMMINGYRIVVFDIRKDSFRLITFIHYNRRIVYIRKFLTHAEYSKGDWKKDP